MEMVEMVIMGGGNVLLVVMEEMEVEIPEASVAV